MKNGDRDTSGHVPFYSNNSEPNFWLTGMVRGDKKNTGACHV